MKTTSAVPSAPELSIPLRCEGMGAGERVGDGELSCGMAISGGSIDPLSSADRAAARYRIPLHAARSRADGPWTTRHVRSKIMVSR